MDGAGISGFCVRFGSVGRKPGPSLTAYITRPGRPIARHQYRLSLSPSAQTPSFETALAVSHLCICSEMASAKRGDMRRSIFSAVQRYA
eukprot:3931916-Rhodomonas_salina.1